MENFINDYQIAKNAISAKNNVRVIFNLLEGHYTGRKPHIIYEYNDVATIILEAVAKFGEGFVVDICTRVIESIKNGKAIALSQKQQWCVAFAAAKLSEDQIEEIQKIDQAILEDENLEDVIENSADETAVNETSEEKTIYSVCESTNINSESIFTSSDIQAADDFYEKHLQSLKVNQPADITGWTEHDQAWSHVYFVELVKITTDEDGDIINMETIRQSEYYWI